MAHFYYHHQVHPAPVAPALASSHPQHRRQPPSHAAPGPSHALAPPVSRHSRASDVSHSKSSSKVHHIPVPALDPILAFHKRPALEFDVSLSPQHVKLLHSKDATSSSFTHLTNRHLASPAVTPPLPFMRITCSPHLLWPIDVYPATHSGIVTVGDVLHAIYRGLRTNVSGSDWRSAPHDTQVAVRDAYNRRCRRHPQAERMHEESRGLRRVDWLMKNTLFQGLRPGSAPDHWEMHVRPGEKSVKFMM